MAELDRHGQPVELIQQRRQIVPVLGDALERRRKLHQNRCQSSRLHEWCDTVPVLLDIPAPGVIIDLVGQVPDQLGSEPEIRRHLLQHPLDCLWLSASDTRCNSVR